MRRVAHRLDRSGSAGELLEAERALADEQFEPIDGRHPPRLRLLDQPRPLLSVDQVDQAAVVAELLGRERQLLERIAAPHARGGAVDEQIGWSGRVYGL